MDKNDVRVREFSIEAISLSSKAWLNRISQPVKYILNPDWIEPSEAEKEAYENMFKCINVGPIPKDLDFESDDC